MRPKGSKVAKIDQNLEFFGFCHHPFHSGKNFSLLLHWSNAKRVVENERREWRPLGAQQGVPKGPKMAKIVQNLIFFGFGHHPFHSGKKILLLLHWPYAERVVENVRGEWRPLGAQQGSPKGPKKAKIDQNLEYFLFCSHPIYSGNKYSLSLHWSYAGGVEPNDKRPWGIHSGVLNGPEWPKLTKISFFWAPIQLTRLTNFHFY